MTIGIIGAMPEEIASLKSNMIEKSKKAHTGMTFYKGHLFDLDVIVVTSGIGKVNAAICTQILIDTYKVDKIINVGIAGGLNEAIYPGDVVIATNLVQHDMDTSFFGDALGQIPRLDTFDFKCDAELIDIAKTVIDGFTTMNSFIGRIVSGDQFIHQVAKLQQLSATFNAYACEMEGAAIGQVCFLNQIPFVVIRSISDNPMNGTHMDYNTFAPLAIKNSVRILEGILGQLS